MGDAPDEKKAEEAKRLILARRARFVAAALASVALTGASEACGGGTEPVPNANDGGASSSSGNPQPCLAPPRDPNPQPCLGALPEDAGRPQPCLDVAYDGGNPQPCLSMPAPDAGEEK